MNGKCFRAWSVATLFLLAVLCSSRAEEEKDKEAIKVKDFPAKGKAFALKEKGKASIVVHFPGKGTFVLAIKSEKESDVNLFVYDEDKKEVDKDDSPGPSCEIKFKPKKAGNYTIEIVNKGPGDNSSTLTIKRPKAKKDKKEE
jgi:hypothetical protein